MLSIEKNFLFIHIPKTGGNSIQNILKLYSEDKIIKKNKLQDGKERFEIENSHYNYSKHATLSIYKRQLPINIYENLFKFTVIRNPYDRLISYYFSPNRKKNEFNREEFIEIIKTTPTIEHYVNEYSRKEIFYQKLGIKINRGQSLGENINRFLSFESLEKDFEDVCKTLNINGAQLPHRNKSEKNHYSYYYDKYLYDLVSKKFKNEIEHFHFEFKNN